MGAWGTGILQNDTTADVWVEFKTLYHSGKSLKEIRSHLEKEYAPKNDGELFADIWTGIAHGQWMCGGLEEYTLNKIKEIETGNKGLDLWKENEKLFKQRKIAISEFIKKIQVPREKALKRKKIVPRPAYFENGDILRISLKANSYLYAVVFSKTGDEIDGSNWIVFSEPSNANNLELEAVLDREILYLDVGGKNNYCRGYFSGIFSARNMSRKIKAVENIGNIQFDDVLMLSPGIGFPDWNNLNDYIEEQIKYLESNKTKKPYTLRLRDFIAKSDSALELKLVEHGKMIRQEWLKKQESA